MMPLGLRSSVRLLTIVPLRWDPRESEYPAARAAFWFPIVGLAIGACLYAVMSLPLPELPRAALTLALWVALSGALHEDALIDSADAGFAAGDATRRNLIRKDPHVGAFGVTASGLFMVMRFAALTAVSAPAVLIAPVVGRCSMAITLLLHAPHESSRLAAGVKQKSVTYVAVGVCVALVAVIAWPALTALLVSLGASYWLTKRMAGASGDVHGACGVLGETVTLYAFLATA